MTAPLDLTGDPTDPMPTAGRQQPLLHVPGATEGTLQWKAQTFQLVNWGGFEGRVGFPFHPGATLISGASGTGKSTLLDAYIALMMPSDTPFNGASNDAVSGRARSRDQRNLISYLRGKTDTTADTDGREVDLILRGKGVATWGAIGMTFVDDHGRQFTALRVYLVPARVTDHNGITMRLATYEGHLDLADLAPLAGQSFAPAALKSAFPGLLTYDSYQAFASRLHTRLGIGANGDGGKALRLLVRIQSGQQIRTVDELYKQMVLERPRTFELADEAIKHFDDLEVSYLRMQTEQEKADLLEPITERHATLTAAQAEIVTLDTFGAHKPGDTPLLLWSLQTEARLLEVAAETNRVARHTLTDELRQAKSALSSIDEQLLTVQEQHRNSGGAALEQLALDLDRAQQEREQRLRTRQELASRIAALAAPLATKADFTDLTEQARQFHASSDTRANTLKIRRDTLRDQLVPLSQEQTRLREERESLEGRSGRVPKYFDDMRRAAAAEAGMDVRDLPFLAELIDVDPAEERWRDAIEVVLGAAARTMLVPDTQFKAFSVAIDKLRLRGRLTYEGAATGPAQPFVGDPERIAGKLRFEDSPFQAWVQRHVSAGSRNALCVQSAHELDGDGFRVTLSGQTRKGSVGAHGRADRANIIGFSNEAALADLDTQLQQTEDKLKRLDAQIAQVDADIAQHTRLTAAYGTLEHYTWDRIDVPSMDERILDLEQQRTLILIGDDVLRALEVRITTLKAQQRDAQNTQRDLERDQESLDTEHGQLVERQDTVSGRLYRIEDEQSVTLSVEQAQRLDAEFTAAVAPADPASLAGFLDNLGRLNLRLSEALRTAQTAVDTATRDLERIFMLYQKEYDDPSLGRSVASYPDYAAILSKILSEGLHERRAEWRRALTSWSGQDLVPLNGQMDGSVAEIESRLAAVNDILAQLPFGADQDRLRIRLRKLSPEHVQVFRRELKALSSGATQQLDDEQLEKRFKELQRFMAKLRRRDDPRAVADLSDRDRLLDVRGHVEITAERHALDGRLLSTHSALGGKSGGESQELVAFIVGAALRFQLGDEDRARPRFAPVFLDEGFVKSDAEFAGRAVQAWKGLGFQLIVGAPLDKVTALEPHMDDLLAITKSRTTHYAYVHRIKDVPAGRA